MAAMANDTVRIAAIPYGVHRRLRVYAARHGITVREATEAALLRGMEYLEEALRGSYEAPPESPLPPR